MTKIATDAGNVSTKAVLEVAEKALDEIIPETVRTVNVVKNNPYLLAGVALVALSSGAAAGYWFAKKRLERVYADKADSEISDMREYYSVLNKEKYPTAEDAVRDLIPEEETPPAAAAKAMVDYQGRGRHLGGMTVREDPEGGVTIEASFEKDEPVQSRNIFVDGKPLVEDEWDQDFEESRRGEEKPYIISHIEFNEGNEDDEDMSLTYFAGDNVLINSLDDERVDDVEGLVGSKNLRKFGHGSDNKDVVYIRNPKRKLNIEVVRSSGHYAREVLGFDEDETSLRHSADRRSRRPWGDDD